MAQKVLPLQPPFLRTVRAQGEISQALHPFPRLKVQLSITSLTIAGSSNACGTCSKKFTTTSSLAMQQEAL